MCRVLRSTLKKTLNEAKKCVDVTADVALVACHFQVNSLTITLILSVMVMYCSLNTSKITF